MLKHIGIPTLDISGRTDWQSLVDREKISISAMSRRP